MRIYLRYISMVFIVFILLQIFFCHSLVEVFDFFIIDRIKG